MARWLAHVLFAGACWRGQPAEPAALEPAPVRVKGATCDEVAANAQDVLAKAQDPQLAARAGQLHALFEQRCEEDGWSIELRRCLAGAQDLEEARLCDQLATDAQRDAFARELEVMIVTEDGP